MNLRRVKVSRIDYTSTCAYVGCAKPAEYRLNLINDVGEMSRVGQDLCEGHYEQQSSDGTIEVVA